MGLQSAEPPVIFEKGGNAAAQVKNLSQTMKNNISLFSYVQSTFLSSLLNIMIFVFKICDNGAACQPAFKMPKN